MRLAGVAFNFEFSVGGGGGVMLTYMILPIKETLPFYFIFKNLAVFNSIVAIY